MTPGTPTTPVSARRLHLEATAAAALAAYGVVGVLHLAGQLTGNAPLADATQSLAVPGLLVALTVQTRLRSRLARFTAGGLAWSWVGDTAPDHVPDSMAFVVLMLSFLVAHVVFVAGFWPWRRTSLLTTRAAWLYGAVAVVMVVACAPRAGVLTVGIAVYAVALALMALLAAGIDRLALVGGVLFLVSDGLLAIGEFVPAVELPRSGFWVMATYLSALLLLTLGVMRRDASRV
ncbi:lysoplasmalogenase family protein [Knoellia sp. LjRoot47]|uniref:lysoplasmalogenase family protein n=1 Tax=Knoellia sp. LjRoot47 TaxID=3342330 RepID=UPI003ECC2149